LFVRITPTFVRTIEKLAAIFATIVKESAGMVHAHGPFRVIRPLATPEGKFGNHE
jgi:hypothetical protein